MDQKSPRTIINSVKVIIKFNLELLLLLLSVSACGGAPVRSIEAATSAPAAASPTSTPNLEMGEDVSTGVYQLVVVAGVVKIKREGWAEFELTGDGTSLELGDQVWPEAGATVQIMCGEGGLRTVTAGVSSGVKVVCPQVEDSIRRDEMSAINTRDGYNQNIPYIISPRASKLLSQTPVLKWNGTGALSYTVRISGNGLKWAQGGLTETELVYPGNPPLKPGKYTMVVEDSSGQVSPNHPSLTFEILNEAEQGKIQATAEAINRLDTISAAARTLFLARFYRKEGLIAEAIALIQALIDQGNASAALYRALGEYYTQIGLEQMAEQPFLTALELAKQENNKEVMIAVQFSLGKFYASLRRAELATEYLEAARIGYAGLGAADQVAQINEILSGL